VPQESDDLLVAEPALPHVRSFLRKRTLLTLDRCTLWRAGQEDKRYINMELLKEQKKTAMKLAA
jgi:hypothetical protein